LADCVVGRGAAAAFGGRRDVGADKAIFAAVAAGGSFEGGGRAVIARLMVATGRHCSWLRVKGAQGVYKIEGDGGVEVEDECIFGVNIRSSEFY
jgi:hypothetical protein